MAYLHCPRCERTAWLDSTTEPVLQCRHCDAVLAPMAPGRAHALAGAVRERFERDMRLDAARPRFLRG
jgi:ribosomal protein L37AE/L43A